MQVFAKHWMPFTDLSADFAERFDSAALYYSNSHYDPVRGGNEFNEWLDLLEHCEELGFDGVSYNEHHQWPHSHVPSANILTAALMRRTTRLKFAPLGHVVPASHPVQLAEEIAMLDVISRGRVIAGVTRGVGTEYYARNITPADGRELFYEQMELMVRAWTSREPFVHDGKFYQLPCVNIWPRPLQQPHPPIWVASSGSYETVGWAAKNRYPLVTGFAPNDAIASTVDRYRLDAERHGYHAPASQIGLSIPIYLAETDEEALRRGVPHFEYLLRGLLNVPSELYFPPGAGPLELFERASERIKAWRNTPVTELNQRGDIILGAPATVLERLEALHKRLDFGILVVTFAMGRMNYQEALDNLELFAKEVLPSVRRFANDEAPARD